MRNSTIVKILLASLLGLALATSLVRAQALAMDFDQGVDVSSLLQEARQAAAEDATVAARAYAGALRYDSDCATITFGPNDKPVSEPVWLRSTEWVEQCDYGDPRHGGGRHCWEMPGFTYNERVQVTLRERQPLLPWEYDSFRVCLQGPWLDIDDIATAYDYKVVQGGSRNGGFVLAPVKKIAMRPDPAGIAPQSLSSSLVLKLKDQWASYYAGEQTVLKVRLKTGHFLGGSTIVEKEIAWPAAESYQVNFLDFAKDFSRKLEVGKKYYVKYQFKRAGKISRQDWTKDAESGEVAYQPGLTGVGR